MEGKECVKECRQDDEERRQSGSGTKGEEAACILQGKKQGGIHVVAAAYPPKFVPRNKFFYKDVFCVFYTKIE